MAKASPSTNLLASLLSLIHNTNDKLEALSEIVKFPADQHGNILIGLDNANFDLWRHKLEYLVLST